jgi:hypothetical protein
MLGIGLQEILILAVLGVGVVGGALYIFLGRRRGEE